MSLEIVDYTEKSLAVFGETKSYRDSFLSLGGKFNASLKRGDEKVAGWIFTKSKRDQLTDLIKNIKSGSVKPCEEKEEPKWVSYKTYLELVTRVERLEAILHNKASTVSNQKVMAESEEDEDSEEEAKPSLLLSKKLKK